MAFSSFARALLLASALPLATLVGAQTVTQNGELIRTRPSTFLVISRDANANE